MKDHCHPDCKNKDSVHYFMSHMTQEEFEERIDGKNISRFEFNMIHTAILEVPVPNGIKNCFKNPKTEKKDS